MTKLTLQQVEKRLIALGCTELDRKPRAVSGKILIPGEKRIAELDYREVLAWMEGNPVGIWINEKPYQPMAIVEDSPATSDDFDLSVLEQSPLEDQPIISLEECAAIDLMVSPATSADPLEEGQYYIHRGNGWEDIEKTVAINVLWWDMQWDYSGDDNRGEKLEQLRNGETVTSNGIALRLEGIDHGWELQGYSLRGSDCPHDHIGMRNNGNPVCLECARIVSHFNVNVPRIAARAYDQLWGDDSPATSADRLIAYLDLFLHYNPAGNGSQTIQLGFWKDIPPQWGNIMDQSEVDSVGSYWQVDQYQHVHNGEFSGEVIATYCNPLETNDPRVALLSFLEYWAELTGDWFDDIPDNISLSDLRPHWLIDNMGNVEKFVGYYFKHWLINASPISQDRAAMLPTLAGIPRVSMAGNPPDSETYYRSHRICAYANGGLYIYPGVGLQNQTTKLLINSVLETYGLPYEIGGERGNWIVIQYLEENQSLSRMAYSGMFLQ